MLNKIKLFNLHKLAKMTGISYNTLRNYSSGRLKELKEEDMKKIERLFEELGGK